MHNILGRSPLDRVLCLFFFVLAAGCDDAPMTLGEYGREYSRATCESMATCPAPGRYSDPSDVSHVMSGACGDYRVVAFAVVLDELDARGHTRVDEVAARRCVEAIRSCVQDNDACDHALIGTLPEGAGCGSDHECASASCQWSGGCGVCAARAPRHGPVLGESCDQDCGYDPRGPLVCVEHVCRFRVELALGDVCGGGIQDSCVAGTFCGQPGVCRAPIALGAPCGAFENECEFGTFCGFFDGESTCRPVVLHQPGESCAVDDSVLSEDGTHIAGDDGTFVRCADSEPTICDLSTAQCVRVTLDVPNGGLCGDAAYCAEGLFCQDVGVCGPKLENGALCSSPVVCASDYCEYVAGGGSFCADREPELPPVCE